MSMKIAIMGAGALGGTFGFFLANAGFDVTLVDVDAAKIDAIRRDGLTLIMPDGSRRHRAVQVTTDPSEVGVVDLVQISVKGYHTARPRSWPAHDRAPHLRALAAERSEEPAAHRKRSWAGRR